MASALVVVACTGGADGADVTAAVSEGTSSGPPPGAVSEASRAASELPARQQILTAYGTYTRLVSNALARGTTDVPGLDQVTTARALRDLRARVEANAHAGVVTDGRLVPSAIDVDVRWDGGDTARVSDCVLNGLSHVAASGGDVVTEATGTRRPVTATLRQVDGRWVVARAQMVQDGDSDNPQQDPPFLRGPMPDGPPSCAPAEIEQEVLAGYRAFWDAFDRAFGFGRDGPANPDDPALPATSVDPQLSESRDFLQDMSRLSRTSMGERDIRNPWVIALTRFDSLAFVGDCVTAGRSRTVEIDSGRIVERNPAGLMSYYDTEMVKREGKWRVSNWDVMEQGITECEPPQ